MDIVGHALCTYLEMGEIKRENYAVMVLRLIGLGEPSVAKGMQREYELCDVIKEEATNSCASRNKRWRAFSRPIVKNGVSCK